MEISFEQGFQGAVVARLRGRLDALEAPTFEGLLAQRMDDGDGRLVLDFSAVDYISSAGLMSLLALARRARAREGGVVVCALTGMVREVFDVAGFQSFLPVTETVAEAEALLPSEDDIKS
jgi:anti-anti-sigma factor